MTTRPVFDDRTGLVHDGRNVDTQLARLGGEGAQQQVKRLEEAFPAPGLTHQPPVLATGFDGTPTYYGRPLLKEPVWIWTIPVYFYVGGVTGACATLAAAVQLAGGRSLRPLVEKLRWVSAAGTVVSGALLVADLGRPGRFLNMLRVFRPTSPMSVGSWLLAGFSGLAAAAALSTRLPRHGRPLGDAAGIGAALFALPFTGYTAVLLNNTSVPIWRETRRSLPPLFIASSMSSAAAATELLELPLSARRVVRRFGLIGRVAELACEIAVEREPRVPEVRRALLEGGTGFMWRLGKALTLGALTLSLVPARYRRAHRAGAVLGTASTLLKKWAVVRAGHASARNPRATVEAQRMAGRQAATR